MAYIVSPDEKMEHPGGISEGSLLHIIGNKHFYIHFFEDIIEESKEGAVDDGHSI